MLAPNDGNTDAVTAQSVEGQHPILATINLHTPNRLGEDHHQDMSGTCDPEGASSFPQRLGEELISTCVTLRRVTQLQAAVKKAKERHLCVLRHEVAAVEKYRSIVIAFRSFWQ